MNRERHEFRQGIWYALACYGIWGLFPLYWYPLNHATIPPDQILAQRVMWSALFSVLLVLLASQGGRLLSALRRPRLLLAFTASAVLIAINWLTYLWAIVNSHVLDASLGYFISPLANVLLGRLLFGERLGVLQWLAVGLAGIGILWLAVPAGQVPWVAVLLALSFSLYGAVRKRAPLEAMPGMALETLVLLPCACAWLLWARQTGTLVFDGLPGLQLAVLVGSGAVTTVPLLCFAGAAHRIPLSLLGMLQYVSPTLQLLMGLVVFNEQFSLQRLIGYGWVWAGVAVFFAGMLLRTRPRPAVHADGAAGHAAVTPARPRPPAAQSGTACRTASPPSSARKTDSG